MKKKDNYNIYDVISFVEEYVYCEKHNWYFPFYDLDVKEVCEKYDEEKNICQKCGKSLNL